MKNEDALFQTGIKTGEVEDCKDVMSPWKLVTLGGVAGILMGAGSLYAGQKITKEVESEEGAGDVPNDQIQDEKLKVADVGQGLSFGQAFAAARAEVGPGGVFYWHGGIYNTFTAEEWNSMSQTEKNDFAQQVRPEIHPNELSTPTDANPQVVVVHHVYHHEDAPTTTEVHQVTEVTETSEDVQIVDPQTAQNFEQGDDVHIVGYASVDGHLAVGYDTTGDGQADVAIIDVDDNRELSDADVIIDDQGNSATVGEVINTPDSNQMAAMENPDVAPDMPDYMNDANIDDINVLA
jgi:hypothetical protein